MPGGIALEESHFWLCNAMNKVAHIRMVLAQDSGHPDLPVAVVVNRSNGDTAHYQDIRPGQEGPPAGG